MLRPRIEFSTVFKITFILFLLNIVSFFGIGLAVDFPNRPITMIVGYGAGGGTDTNARLIQPYLEKELGVPVVVTNASGAGTEVATTKLFRGPPDGYNILVSDQPALNLSLALRKTAYSPNDIVPIIVELLDPRILQVRKDAPFDNLNDFIEMAKKSPGKYSISVTQGGGQHVLAKWLATNLGLDLGVVGYSSGGQCRSAMLGGQVTATIADDYTGYKLRNETKALAIANDKMSRRWPEAKTFDEQLKTYGLKLPSPDFMSRFQIYSVRKELKEKYPERYKLLQEAFERASKNSEYKEKVKDLGFTNIQLWARGEKYIGAFSEDLKVLKQMVAEGKIGL